MNCLHKYIESKRFALVYCQHCGDPKPLDVAIAATLPPPPAPAPGTQPPRPPKQSEFPFGVPVTIGENGQSMFESPTPTDDAIMDLERDFFGADPETQAALIEAFRKARNIPRTDQDDVSQMGTYVPGQEVPPGQPNFDAPPPPAETVR